MTIVDIDFALEGALENISIGIDALRERDVGVAHLSRDIVVEALENAVAALEDDGAYVGFLLSAADLLRTTMGKANLPDGMVWAHLLSAGVLIRAAQTVKATQQ